MRAESDAEITMLSGAVIDAQGGTVDLAAQTGVLLGRVVSPGATVTISAGQGGIADGAGAADPADADGADIEAEAAVLTAGGSIGSRVERSPEQTALVRLDTKVHRLHAVSANGVGIFLVNDGPMVIDRAEANRSVSPYGIVDISTTSPLTVAGVVRGASVELTAAKGVDGVTSDDNLTLLAGSIVESTQHGAILRAAGAVIVEDGAIQISPLGKFVQNDAAPPEWVGRCDVNGDGQVTPLDALIVINHLNRYTLRRPEPLLDKLVCLDVNRDREITPLDVLQILNLVHRDDDWS
jgi:hypothetical protein